MPKTLERETSPLEARTLVDSGDPKETSDQGLKVRQQALIVLGPHRSGTSALTRVLSLCGAQLPSHILRAEDGLPNDGNTQAGFWESRPLLVLHEEILESSGSRWDDPYDIPSSWFDSDSANVFAQRLAETLKAEFGAAPLFVAKDPRISRLVPLWDRALRHLGAKAHWLIAVRNPLDVAASLEARDHFSQTKGLLVWLTYFLAAERYTRQQDRLFVLYDDLLESWQEVVARVAEKLGVAFCRRSPRAAAEIDAFLDPSLRHHAAPPGKLDLDAQEGIAQWVKHAFEWALRAAAGDPVAGEQLDDLRQDLLQAEKVYTPLLAAAELDVARMQQEAEELREEKRETQSQLGRQLDQLQDELADREQRLAGVLGELEELRRSVQRQQTDRQEDLAEREQSLAKTHSELEELRHLVQGQQASHHQRLTKAQRELAELRHLVQRQNAGLTTRVRTLAFFLPQYHPIPENDMWWGKGFTEWTNVTSAQPCFEGHEQPVLPSELGFYDLRVPGVRSQQAALAREHRIDGFCYYYYWFDGRKLLEHPLEEMIASGEPDFPFCICWANENWTRRWDGEDDQILLAQNHSPEGDARFIEDVLPALLDPRYIKKDGKPLLLVYRADLLAEALSTTAAWREAARLAGLPGLHLCAVWRIEDPLAIGFDALVEFPPHHILNEEITHQVPGKADDFSGRILDYAAAVDAVAPLEAHEFPVYRGVMPAWDNTPRRGKRASLFSGSTPELYQKWLEAVLRESAARPGDDDQFVFVNAWNEWAEGATLEPSRRHGRGYLEATRSAVREAAEPKSLARTRTDLKKLERRLDDQTASWATFDDRLAALKASMNEALAEHQSSLSWLRSVDEDIAANLAGNRSDVDALGDSVEKATSELAGHQATLETLAGTLGKQSGELEALARQTRSLVTRDQELRRVALARQVGRTPHGLWLSRHYGVWGLLLKLPIWILSGRLTSRLSWWQQARRILRTGLFDSQYYLERYPEVAASGIDPLYHYVRLGASEGRNPNALFNTHRYLERHPDAATSGNPLLHYLTVGIWDRDLSDVLPDQNPQSRAGSEPAVPTEGTVAEATCKADLTSGRAVWTFNQDQLARRDTATTVLLFVSHDGYRAGAQIILLEVIKSFSRLPEFELYLLMRNSDGELRGDFERYAHVLDVREQSDPGGSEESTVIAAVQAMEKPPALALCNSVASGPVAKILRQLEVPVVSLVYELPTTIESLGRGTLYDTMSSSQTVIAASEFVKNALLERYEIPAEILQVLHVGVIGWQPELESRQAARRKVLATYGLPDDAVLVLGCGMIHHRKGTDLFVQVARNAIVDYGIENAYFLWVGSEQVEHFRSWCEHDVAAFGLRDRVLFTGEQVSTADYYLAADVFLLTSREDPFPLVNLEALARGLPVVAFRNAGGAQEALTEDVGLVVPYLDTAAMTRALVRLVEATRYRAEFRERALARVEERYRWDHFFAELRQLVTTHAAPSEHADMD